jgi:hypothetical protein
MKTGMTRILIIGLLLMSTALCRAQEKGSVGLHDQKLINWMRSHISPITGMPFSFEPLGIKQDVFMKIGPRYSATGIIERMIVDQGISIYDAALWQIVLSHTGKQHDLDMACMPVKYYWEGSLNEFSDIRTGSGNQIFVYDPGHPDAVTSDLSKKGYRGFIFRIMNANGLYLSADPVDGKNSFQDFPNDARIHWEDWKPIAGENAWVVLAAAHLLKYIPKEHWGSSIEFKLAREITRAALYLQAANGGIRMAPLGTYFHLLDIPTDFSEEKITQVLDERAKRFKQGLTVPKKDLKRLGGIDYPPYHTWYYEEISTENNLSWYAALRMMYRVTGHIQYWKAMERIEDYFKSVWDPKEKIFYQGAHFINGKWVPNTSSFAVDVQNWSIAVLGPKKIDQWFGEGSAYGIWRSTKVFSGVFGHDGLKGVGFTKEKDRISIEWTAGAILAARKLAAYYAFTHPDWSKETKKDAISMRAGMDDYYFNVRPGEAAYSYSSIRRWIPFGWFSHNKSVLSLASTAWIVLVDKKIDPFVL